MSANNRMAASLFAVLAALGCARVAPQPAAVTPPTPALPPGDYNRTFAFAGRERKYTIHLPSGMDDRTARPLVMVLHGGGGDDDNAAHMTGMSAKADRESFVVAYPDGTGRRQDRLLTWNAGTCCGYALESDVDDVGMLRALIDQVSRDHPIDPKRIYATGMSNGGMMTYRLGCELSDRLAAIAPVAGALNVACQPTQPVAVIAFHGTADPRVLYDGGAPATALDLSPRVDNSVASAIAFWVGHNQCQGIPQTTERGTVTVTAYVDCRARADVVLYTLKGFRHAWPGGTRAGLLGDDPRADISATDEIWGFFAKHPKP